MPRQANRRCRLALTRSRRRLRAPSRHPQRLVGIASRRPAEAPRARTSRPARALTPGNLSVIRAAAAELRRVDLGDALAVSLRSARPSRTASSAPRCVGSPATASSAPTQRSPTSHEPRSRSSGWPTPRTHSDGSAANPARAGTLHSRPRHSTKCNELTTPNLRSERAPHPDERADAQTATDNATTRRTSTPHWPSPQPKQTGHAPAPKVQQARRLRRSHA